MTILLKDHPVSTINPACYERVTYVRAMQMRREAYLNDRVMLTEVTPRMLEDYGLDPWDGMYLGMRCVPSPIIRACPSPVDPS